MVIRTFRKFRGSLIAFRGALYEDIISNYALANRYRDCKGRLGLFFMATPPA
jgi:hypothetical protein